MSRPIIASISRSAFAHNLQQVRQAAPKARLWAVIKANAYGHGLLTAATALASADGFAILTLDDALRLRGAGWQKPVLLLEGVFSAEDYEVCAAHDLTPVIHDERQLRWLDGAQLSRPLAIYVKINTGMNRLGLAPESLTSSLQRLRQMTQVRELTLMTHFALADVDGGTAAQFAVFQRASAGSGLPACLANSAAILSARATHADWVRPGIMLYGSSPFADRTASELGLQAVMTLSSELIAVQSVRAGDTVGYGGRFVAERPMRIGVVACGYADGYPRHAPDGTPILVHGRHTRLIGRVSMDMLTVDLEHIPEAAPGSPVELWGSQVPVDAVAASAGTISYELLAALAPRVARRST